VKDIPLKALIVRDTISSAKENWEYFRNQNTSNTYLMKCGERIHEVLDYKEREIIESIHRICECWDTEAPKVSDDKKKYSQWFWNLRAYVGLLREMTIHKQTYYDSCKTWVVTTVRHDLTPDLTFSLEDTDTSMGVTSATRPQTSPHAELIGLLASLNDLTRSPLKLPVKRPHTLTKAYKETKVDRLH
jgi:hypothetical protein